MEQNFQTSFIPKNTMVNERAVAPKSVSFLVIGSIFVLLAVSVGIAGLFFYKKTIESNNKTMEEQLNRAKTSFEPSKLAELQLLDRRLNAANQVLAKHIAVTPIFKAIQDVTLKNVRFTDFSYTLSSDGLIQVKMKGITIGYRSVALQADLFTKNKNIIDPVFSNLTLDEKGNVLFDLDFSVDHSFVDYKQTLLAETPSVQADNSLDSLDLNLDLDVGI